MGDSLIVITYNDYHQHITPDKHIDHVRCDNRKLSGLLHYVLCQNFE